MLKMIKSSANKKYTDYKNILSLIRKHSPITKGQLEQLAGLKLPTLNRIVNILLEEKVIQASDTGESSGGRKPLLFSLAPSSGYIIGVDISRTYTKVALMDMSCKIIKSEVFGMFQTSTPVFTMSRVTDIIFDFTTDIDKSKLLGIGVGVPGPLNKEKGLLLNTMNFPAEGWNNVSIKDKLEEATGLLVFVENGANLAALGEYCSGSGKSFDTLAYVISGVGLRLGIVAEGNLVSPSLNDETAFGRTVINADSHLDETTSCGVLESYVSIGSVLERFISSIRKGKHSIALQKVDYDISSINFNTFCDAANTGDELALEVLQHTAKYYSIGLTNLIYILNPNLIILGGPLMTRCISFYAIILDILEQKLKTFSSTSVRFSKGSLAEDAIVVGAANLVLDYYLA